ncbi:MAG: hypothetical protein ACXABK_05495 [Candidatus Heimdallarchaeaceae archaeon]|jgi:hypothetical protein
MFPHSPQSSVPPDKLVQQLIVQAIQAFYVQDYETGIYFLKQISSNLPRYMYQLNPQNRSLCKEIVKLLQDGSLVPDRSASSFAEAAEDTHPGLSGIESEPQLPSETTDYVEQSQEPVTESPYIPAEPVEAPSFSPTEETPVVEQPSLDQSVEMDERATDIPSEFISELSSAVNAVKDKKKKKTTEKLTGSMDELEDFDF